MEPPVAPFVRQLTDVEMQQFTNFGIMSFGAGYNINIFKEEDNPMIEKLMMYRAELEEKKHIFESPIDLTSIDADVEAYRNRLIEEAEEARALEIQQIESDIACINGIIAREEEAAAAALETQTTEPTV